MEMYSTITSFETRVLIESYDMTFVLRRIKDRDTKKYGHGWKMSIKTDNKRPALNPAPWILSKVIHEIFEDADDQTPISYIEYEYKIYGKKKTIWFNSQSNRDKIHEKLLKEGYRA